LIKAATTLGQINKGMIRYQHQLLACKVLPQPGRGIEPEDEVSDFVEADQKDSIAFRGKRTTDQGESVHKKVEKDPDVLAEIIEG
jgi:hypothetical protein